MKTDHDGLAAVTENSVPAGVVSFQPERRSMLRSVKEVRKSPSIVSHDSQDAELIALGETFQFLIRQEASARDRANRLIARSRASAVRKSGMRHLPCDVGRAEELKIKNFDAITDKMYDLSDQVGRLIDAIWAIQPRTLAGIKVYAAVVRYWQKDSYDDCDEYGVKALDHLIRAILDNPDSTQRSNSQRVSVETVAA